MRLLPMAATTFVFSTISARVFGTMHTLIVAAIILVIAKFLTMIILPNPVRAPKEEGFHKGKEASLETD
jgi:hypothetical protein